jgi:hypothetical protein
VVDVTHGINNNHIYGDFGDEKEYVGVQFNKKLILDRLMSGKDSTSFIDNWTEGWPVLQKKWEG